jgi:hypothetical protein
VSKKEHKAWAIDTRSSEGHGLIGKFWWFDKIGYIRFQRHMDGYYAAMWRTRRQARIDLPRVKRSFPKARVVRVYISIKWKE